MPINRSSSALPSSLEPYAPEECPLCRLHGSLWWADYCGPPGSRDWPQSGCLPGPALCGGCWTLVGRAKSLDAFGCGTLAGPEGSCWLVGAGAGF